mmetsp:Transcript_15857/g.26359  ORF Transcript_15857/g.26359 Transcript_15857/m.26359 type:complete len:443 (-) Transcript_15857:1071-2399(-)
MVYSGGEETGGKRIYIGNINYEVREEELRNFFSEYGPITQVSYKQGFAFIDYADKRDAQDAIAQMNDKTVGGRRLRVEHSKDAVELASSGGSRPPSHRRSHDEDLDRDHRDRRSDYRADVRGNFSGGGGNSRNPNSSEFATKNLFVANIPDQLTEARVEDHFTQYGRVLTVKFLPQKSDTKAAFVDFENVDDARAAHDNTNVLEGSRLRTDYNKRGSGGPSGGGSDRGGDDRSDDRGGGRGYDSYAGRGGGGSSGRIPEGRPPASRYDDRLPAYDDRPPSYDDRRYDERRYDDRRYDDRRYDERPPAPRYEDRRYDAREDYRNGRDRDYMEDRRYDDRRYDDRGRYEDRRYESRPPAPRYDERRYDDRRYDERPERYDDRRYGGGPGPPRGYSGDMRYDSVRYADRYEDHRRDERREPRDIGGNGKDGLDEQTQKSRDMSAE